MVQLSHPYMTTGKTIALMIRTFVGKVMSLLFNTLSLKKCEQANIDKSFISLNSFSAHLHIQEVAVWMGGCSDTVFVKAS